MTSRQDRNQDSIPKVIHHTWFGKDPYPKLVQKCIASWKKHLPDYDIITWTPDNFDMDICPWVRESYEAKKYAYTADYVRYYVLHNYGGIYLDADVEVKKNFDSLLNSAGFIAFLHDHLTGVVLGSVKGLSYFGDVIDSYNNTSFLKGGVSEVEFLESTLIRDGLLLNGKFQEINGFCVYPYTYFPWTSLSSLGMPLDNAYALHRPYGSWRDSYIYSIFNRCFSNNYELFNNVLNKTLGEEGTRNLINKLFLKK